MNWLKNFIRFSGGSSVEFFLAIAACWTTLPATLQESGGSAMGHTLSQADGWSIGLGSALAVVGLAAVAKGHRWFRVAGQSEPWTYFAWKILVGIGVGVCIAFTGSTLGFARAVGSFLALLFGLTGLGFAIRECGRGTPGRMELWSRRLGIASLVLSLTCLLLFGVMTIVLDGTRDSINLELSWLFPVALGSAVLSGSGFIAHQVDRAGTVRRTARDNARPDSERIAASIELQAGAAGFIDEATHRRLTDSARDEWQQENARAHQADRDRIEEAARQAAVREESESFLSRWGAKGMAHVAMFWGIAALAWTNLDSLSPDRAEGFGLTAAIIGAILGIANVWAAGTQHHPRS